MYTIGLDEGGPAAHAMMQRQFETIDAINQIAMALTDRPSSASEMALLESRTPESLITLTDTIFTGVRTALESLLMIRASYLADASTLGGLRALLRTALLGASRVGYVLCAATEQERVDNAQHVVGVELTSFHRAAKSLHGVQILEELRPSNSELETIEKAATELKPNPKIRGENSIIQGFAEHVERIVEEKGGSDSAGAFSDSLKWIWQASSGVAHSHAWPAVPQVGNFVTDLSIVVPAAHIASEAAVDAWTGRL